MGNLKQYKGTKVVEKFMEMYISNLFLFYNIMWRIDGIQWNPVVKAGKVLLKKHKFGCIYDMLLSPFIRDHLAFKTTLMDGLFKGFLRYQ